MAALLRGQPALRRIIAFVGRSQVKETLNCHKIVQNSHQRFKATYNTARNYATYYQQKPKAFGLEWMQRQRPTSPRNVDDALNMIDREVRRVGRIKKDVVMGTYAAVQESSSVTGHQSLLLLRCFGSVMVDESPAVRLQLAESLWTGLKALGAKYDVTHYNALLQVYIQNEHKFSPSEFLAMAESEGIKPNRVTYQRMIAGYCQTGDVQGASQILEHMKTANIPINETVFNSLIMGHMRAGDVESATGVFKIMRESDISPSGDTYSTLMMEHARKGDIESIEKVSREAEESQVMLQPSHYFDVLQSLCSNGYNQHVDKVMSLVPKSGLFGYNQECVTAVLQMVARGHDDVAHKLFLSMQHPTPIEGTEVTLGRFLIKEMVKHERPIENVVGIMKDMTSRGLNTDRLDFIAQWALVYEKPVYALEAFSLMDREGLPLRTHFFWPVFIAYGKQKNAQGIYNAVKMMEEKVQESHDFIYTLNEQVIPSLMQAGEDFETIKDNLMELNILEGDINFARMIHLMKAGKNKEAVTLLKEKEIRFHHSVLLQYLFAWFKATKDTESILEVLESAQNGPAITTRNARVTDLATRFLFNFMDLFKTDSPKVESFVRSMVEKKLGVTDSEALKQRLTGFGLSSDLIQQLTSTEVAADLQRPESRQFEQISFGTKSVEELEKILAENRANDYNVKGPLRWLLEKYCHSGNATRADEIKAELDGLGFIYTPDLIRSMMHLAAWHKKDLSETKKYMEMLESEHPNFRAFTSEVINLAALHALQGNTAGAIDTLKEYHAKHGSYMEEKNLGDSYMNEIQCVNLIKNCQAAGLMEAPVEIINTLFEFGYIKKGCYRLLSAYVEGYVEKGDVDGALEAISYCHKQYRRVPVFESIFRILIEREDPEKLQQVMDMASANLGEMQALHHLMYCCVECGKDAQAKRILETPGMRAMMDLLEQFGNQLITKKKIKELESLVEVTRGLFGLDREQMLFLLMKGYCHEEKLDKALNVLTVMEEENINARGRTLRYLGNALKTANMEVPFTIPDIPTPIPKQGVVEQVNTPSEQVGPVSSLSPQELEVIKEAASGNVTTIQEIKESVGGTLSPSFLTEMAHSLLRSQRKGSLKYFVHELAGMGDVQALEELRNMNLRVFNMGMIHVAISKAYLESGKPEKMLDKLQSDPKNLTKYLSTDVCNRFNEKYPSMFKQFEDLILGAADQGNMQALNFLWQHYCVAEHLDKCTKLLQRYPALSKELRIAEPCVHAKNNNREDLLQFIINMSKDNASNHKFAYSYLLGLKCEHNDWQGALNVLEKVKEDGFTTDDLRPLPLAVLESLLVANSQTVPWQIGKYGQVSPKAVSSESSTASVPVRETSTKVAETVA